MENKISVIIPTYNTEKYIKQCVDSILNQTYQNFEIIIVNDGSTDNTSKILNAMKSDRIKVLDIENSGQGYARNLALKHANGDYVMFMDSDDFIEPVTFEVAIKRILEDGSDFVYYDWKYYKDKTGEYSYTSKEEFFHKKILQDDECKQLLKIQHYFTVNKLYSKKFLIDNNVIYGERYIYEDIPFWVKASMYAKKVSIIHSPLYNVRTNEQSTTKTNLDTDRHVNGFLKAFDESIKVVGEGKYKYLFLDYMMNKFLLYYNKRTPRKLKKYFMQEFYERIKDCNINKFKNQSRVIKTFYSIKPLKSNGRFRLFAGSSYRIEHVYKQLRKKVTKVKELIANGKNKKYLKKYNNKLKKQILFMGFDYRYTGNSRYLYEKMVSMSNEKIYFVTENELVPESNRIKPNSKEFYEKLYSSKVVVFESWIPKKFNKPQNAIWINLWHGTPLKKMLYDSNEEEIILTNKNHKKDKFGAINKLDFLLVDNPNVSHYFETSFLLDKKNILEFGYPRVEYLIANKDNKKLKKEIRKKLNVKENQKIIMYLPTWRDYNYKNDENCDFNYFLDKDELLKELNDKNYKIISKDHAFLRKAKDMTITDIETQELLLVSDYVVTDYSSVMFDAFAIDIPVCIIAKDYEKYSKSRGLYTDMWQELKPFVAENEKELSKLIKNYKMNEEYIKIKEKYCYKSEGDIVNFIKDILK